MNEKNVYHLFWIWKSNEWKIVFQTTYRLFGYIIILLELTNISASLQFYIHHVFISLLNDTFIVYMDDVLVFLLYFSQQKKYDWKVHKNLPKIGLYAKLSKSLFIVSRILFIGFISKDKDMQMKKHRIFVISN